MKFCCLQISQKGNQIFERFLPYHSEINWSLAWQTKTPTSRFWPGRSLTSFWTPITELGCHWLNYLQKLEFVIKYQSNTTEHRKPGGLNFNTNLFEQSLICAALLLRPNVADLGSARKPDVSDFTTEYLNKFLIKDLMCSAVARAQRSWFG